MTTPETAMAESQKLGSILDRIAGCMDRIDELDAQAAPFRKELSEAKAEAMRLMLDSGQTKAGSDALTASIGREWIVNYDPEKWDAIAKALIAGGFAHCIQRRITASKIMEMIDTGAPLPDGLTPQQIPQLNIRRRSAPAK